MGTPSDISEPIIEALYCEALVLADEARMVFDLRPIEEPEAGDPFQRLALSIEGLRTTTRIMHVLAWLLNQRAYFASEMSEFQLRRYGTLPPDRPTDPANLAYLDQPTQHLIAASEAIHARITRLDRAWREGFRLRPSAVHSLRERLGREVGRI
jgi:regulator of CtrA degradation